MYFTYILKSQIRDWYYIGQTDNLNRRITRHNRGRVTSTRHYRPFDLVYSAKFLTRQEAVKEELRLKSLKHGEEFKKLINQ